MAITNLSDTTAQTLHTLYDQMAYQKSQDLIQEAFSKPFCMDKIEFIIAKLVINVLSERRSQCNKLSLAYEKQKDISVRKNAESYRNWSNLGANAVIGLLQGSQVLAIAAPESIETIVGFLKGSPVLATPDVIKDLALKLLSSGEHLAQTGKSAYDNMLQADRIELQANSEHYNMRCNQANQEVQTLSQEEIAALNALREALRQKNETLSRIAQ